MNWKALFFRLLPAVPAQVNTETPVTGFTFHYTEYLIKRCHSNTSSILLLGLRKWNIRLLAFFFPSNKHLCYFSFTILKHRDAQLPHQLLKVTWWVRLRTLQKDPNPKGSGSRTPRALKCQTVCTLLVSRLSFLPGHRVSSTNVNGKGSPIHEHTKHSRKCTRDNVPGGYPNIQKLSASTPYMHRDAKPGVLQESHA